MSRPIQIDMASDDVVGDVLLIGHRGVIRRFVAENASVRAAAEAYVAVLMSGLTGEDYETAEDDARCRLITVVGEARSHG